MVEVATADDLAALIRDSPHPAATVLALTPDAWRDLTLHVTIGDTA